MVRYKLINNPPIKFDKMTYADSKITADNYSLYINKNKSEKYRTYLISDLLHKFDIYSEKEKIIDDYNKWKREKLNQIEESKQIKYDIDNILSRWLILLQI
jgi:hypothetical protein